MQSLLSVVHPTLHESPVLPCRCHGCQLLLIPPIEHGQLQTAPSHGYRCYRIPDYKMWQYLELLQHIHQPVKSHRIIKYYYDST